MKFQTRFVCGVTIFCLAEFVSISSRSATGMLADSHGTLESHSAGSNAQPQQHVGFTYTSLIINNSKVQIFTRDSCSKIPSHSACLSSTNSLSYRHMHALANVLESSYDVCIHLSAHPA